MLKKCFYLIGFVSWLALVACSSGTVDPNANPFADAGLRNMGISPWHQNRLQQKSESLHVLRTRIRKWNIRRFPSSSPYGVACRNSDIKQRCRHLKNLYNK